MGKAISKAGCLLFIAAVIGAIFRTGPDDPVTASMKASGVYYSFVKVLCGLTGIVLIWLIYEIRVTVKLHRKLEDLKRRRGR
jgi:hypothetical protein